MAVASTQYRDSAPFTQQKNPGLKPGFFNHMLNGRLYFSSIIFLVWLPWSVSRR